MTITTSLLMTIVFCASAASPSSGDITSGATATNGARRVESGRMLDKYGVLLRKEETARLDNLAAQLKTEPHSKGYLVIYEGSDGPIRNLKARACRNIQHLVRRGVNSKQVVAMMISGGHREKFTVELWMWPLEASDDLPRFQLGVDEKDVSIIRGVEVARKCGQSR
jgi:hypothetical protein